MSAHMFCLHFHHDRSNKKAPSDGTTINVSRPCLGYIFIMMITHKGAPDGRHVPKLLARTAHIILAHLYTWAQEQIKESVDIKIWYVLSLCLPGSFKAQTLAF
jgi:hypothetical protein